MVKKFDTAQVNDFISTQEDTRAEETRKLIEAFKEEKDQLARSEEQKAPSFFNDDDHRMKDPLKVKDVRFSMVMTGRLRRDLETLAYLKGCKSSSTLVHEILEEAVEKHRAEINAIEKARR